MAMAGVGLAVLGINLSRAKDALFNRNIFWVSLFALAVSFAGYISTTLNGTSDFSYASYIVSMWVWLSAAYVVVTAMKWVHGKVDCQLICDYIIAVCVAQCLIAIVMDFYPPLKSVVDSFLGGEGFMGKNETRLYGVGAALDVAGSRFAIALIIIAFFLSNTAKYVKNTPRLLWYLIAFVIILVIGNMMARTTIVGLIFVVVIIVLAVRKQRISTAQSNVNLKLWLLCVVGVSTLLMVYMYHTNEMMHYHIRFAFEGFFSLVEKGHWEVRSNTQLLHQWHVDPINLKTWLIGDGYFQGHNADPHYIGSYGFFYGDSDVGYLRFIYYFGMLGLALFSLFFCVATYFCCKTTPAYKILYICILLVNFAIWAKVSTDIFLVFALFLLLENEADTSECGAELTE